MMRWARGSPMPQLRRQRHKWRRLMVVQESQRPNVGEVTFPTVLNRDVPRATWYRSDGQVLHGLPCDPYHYKIYCEGMGAISSCTCTGSCVYSTGGTKGS